MALQEKVLAQFDPIDKLYEELIQKERTGGWTAHDVEVFHTLASALVERLSMGTDAYKRHLAIAQQKPYGSIPKVTRQGIVERAIRPHLPANVHGVHGVVTALKKDVLGGFLTPLEEIAHAEAFDEVLSSAKHLLDKNFKDPCAVMAGGVLEAHLRTLCKKNGLDTEHNGAPKKAESLNQELAKAGVYGVTDQKGVTHWLGLRNEAAHGHYDKYEKPQVENMVSNLEDFLRRNPA